MPTKIRLQRRGRKKRPFFHIVIADGRAPRDGRFIEKIGTYNPLPQPAEVDIDFDKALDWLQKGAQPTATVRAILSYKGILYKNHLQKGVKKGALTQEEANQKFEAWLKEKEEKIANEAKNIDQKKKEAKERLLEAERKINEERAAEIAKRKKVEIEGDSEQASEEQASEEQVSEEQAEEQAKENAEAPAAEAKENAEAAPEEQSGEDAPAEESSEEAQEKKE